MTNTKYNVGDILEIHHGDERRIWDGMQVVVTEVDTTEDKTWYPIQSHTARGDGLYQPGYNMGRITDDTPGYVLKYRAVQPEPETLEVDGSIDADSIDYSGEEQAAKDWSADGDYEVGDGSEYFRDDTEPEESPEEGGQVFYADITVTIGHNPNEQTYSISNEGTNDEINDWVNEPMKYQSVEDMVFGYVHSNDAFVMFPLKDLRSLEINVYPQVP